MHPQNERGEEKEKEVNFVRGTAYLSARLALEWCPHSPHSSFLSWSRSISKSSHKNNVGGSLWLRWFLHLPRGLIFDCHSASICRRPDRVDRKSGKQDEDERYIGREYCEIMNREWIQIGRRKNTFSDNEDLKGLLSTVSEIWKSFPFAASRFACNYRGVKSKAHPPRMRGRLTDRPTDVRPSPRVSLRRMRRPTGFHQMSPKRNENREFWRLCGLRTKERKRRGGEQGRKGAAETEL